MVRRGRLVWGLGAVVAAVALAVSPVVGVSTAQAEDVILSQPFVAAMGLDGLKAQGFDGSGVTIAVIDGNVDLTVPELAGADIEVKAACTSKGAYHGTDMVADLANPVWGWAPKAHFLVYGADGIVSSTGYDDTTKGCGGYEDDMVQRAISDGADIINISASLVVGPYTMARAAMRGIPIIIGSGNFGQYGDGVDSPFNSVVIVGATDMSGQRSEYSQYGQGLTVVAPADPNTYRIPDDQGDLTRIISADGGTSAAAPMVTGVLALAMQKWPEANGNQLIASLIATSDRAGQWDEFYGWGLVNAAGLISNDPSQYSTENPLMDAIPGEELTQQQYDDYVNGTVEFSSSISPYDTDYTPAPSASPTPDTTTSGGVASWVVPVCVGVVVVIAGVVVVLIVVSRRHRAAPAMAPQVGPYPAQAYAMVPPQGYPPSGPPPGYPSSPPQGFGYPPGSPPGYGSPQGYPQSPPQGYGSSPQGVPVQGYPQGVPSQQPPVQPPPGWVPPSSPYSGGPRV